MLKKNIKTNIKNKHNFFKYLFVFIPLLGAFFTSCSSKNIIIPPEVNISVSAEQENMFGFSNTGFYSTGVTYQIDLSGEIQNGDILELQINNQIVDKKPVYYLYIPFEYQQIILSESSSTSISFPVEQFAFTPKDIFLLNFDLIVRVIRNDDVVFRKEIKDFLYYNSTPTFDEMFLVDDSTKINQGLDLSKSWVLYQLGLCNMFLQPSNVVSIASNAFFDGTTSLLPESIQCINLSTANDYLGITDNLESVETNAFRSSHAQRLILPQTLQTIKTNAFADCNQLNEIDLSLYDALPTKWEKNAFDGVGKSLGQPGTVYISNDQFSNAWKSFFEVNEPNSTISQWNFKAIEK